MKLATLCYLQNNDKTLMLHRVKKDNDMHEGKWNGLGGKLEPGESPEDCARREIKEESGLVAGALQFKGILTFPRFNQNEDWYVFVYLSRDFSGTLIDSPEGHLHWVDNKRLIDLKLWEGDYIFMPWLNQPKIFSAKFEYEDGQLQRHTVAFY